MLPELREIWTRIVMNFYLKSQGQNYGILLGPRIATLFATKAASTLDNRQIDCLIDYFSRDLIDESEYRNQVLKCILHNFYEQEISLSQQDPLRLAKPCGTNFAELGIVLHIQTLDGIVEKL
jgi:hypothetical protein